MENDAHHTKKSVLRSMAEPRLGVLRLRTSMVPDWYGRASMSAKATKAFLEGNQRILEGYHRSAESKHPKVIE